MTCVASLRAPLAVPVPVHENVLKRRAPYTVTERFEQHQFDDGLVVEESRPKLKRPPMYKVVLINDDYTPMEFVVRILEQFFFMRREQATQIMLEVHTQGKGICGIYTHEIAETKVARVNEYARGQEHPLLCMMEKT